MTIFIGIDPGLSGGVAILWPSGTVEVYDTPTAKSGKGSDYLTASMVELLWGVRFPELPVAALEQGMAMPRQGSTSTFKTGRGCGLWEGILAGLGIPYELVAPQRWKRALGLPAGADKSASRLYAQRLFPQVADRFARVRDDGRAEAALLAEWRRRQGGAQQAAEGVAAPESVTDGNAPQGAS